MNAAGDFLEHVEKPANGAVTPLPQRIDLRLDERGVLRKLVGHLSHLNGEDVTHSSQHGEHQDDDNYDRQQSARAAPLQPGDSRAKDEGEQNGEGQRQ